MNVIIKKIKQKSFWIFGFAAFLWFILRTGTNPKRLTYPCQQAVFPIASGWLLATLALLTGNFFLRRFGKFFGILSIMIGVVWFLLTLPYHPSAAEKLLSSLPIWEVQNPISQVFVMDNVPPTTGSLAPGDSTVPNSFLPDPAIDTLLLMMAAKNIHLHKTTAHPSGIVGTDNVVIIKGNFQWTSRNTTSTDRVKGLIWQILNHPDGFTGEILICDNTQEIGTGINENDNNSDDPSQSIVDVVHTFQAKGYPVYYLDWNYIWSSVASEYSAGDYNNGYVYDSTYKISYPKFRSPSNNYFISLRYGIWDSLTTQYDKSRLCIIDFPVLKAHSIAGATIAIKNWIGVLTTAYATERYGSRNQMHNVYLMGPYALVARVMAVTFPKLTIVDAAWTTTYGPSNLTYIQKTNMLLASTDPAAVSWYSAKFILTPIAVYPNNTNPDLQGSAYRNSLTNWTTFLHDSAGYPCTKDSSKISVYDRNILLPLNAIINPRVINFGEVIVDSAMQALVSIRNSGSTNLIISSITSTNGIFSVSTDSALIPPFDSLKLTVTFSPHDTLNHSGYIILDHNGVTEKDSIFVTGSGVTQPTILTLNFPKGWNIISLPLKVHNPSRSFLFPTSNSEAYTFEVSGYTVKDSLKGGIGYWLKFSSPTSVDITGWIRSSDTVAVRKGWNLIGTVSYQIPADNVQQIPDGIIASKFFAYNSGYKEVDTLLPGRGYWIKAKENGKIVFPTF